MAEADRHSTAAGTLDDQSGAREGEAAKAADPLTQLTGAAAERTVVHLFQLGYAPEQIARVSGMSMDRVHKVVLGARTPKRSA